MYRSKFGFVSELLPLTLFTDFAFGSSSSSQSSVKLLVNCYDLLIFLDDVMVADKCLFFITGLLNTSELRLREASTTLLLLP